MQISLKGPSGDVIQSYSKGKREYVKIAGMEYEVYSPVELFDQDPEIRDMIESSELDIKENKVFSTEDMIEAVKRGEM